MPLTDEQAALMPFMLAVIPVDIIGADRRFEFYVPIGCTVTSIVGSAAAADGTDKFTASLRTGTTAIIVTDLVDDVATLHRVTAAESGQTLDRAAGEALNIFIDVTGTAANILGLYAVVWAIPRLS